MQISRTEHAQDKVKTPPQELSLKETFSTFEFIFVLSMPFLLLESNNYDMKVQFLVKIFSQFAWSDNLKNQACMIAVRQHMAYE